MEEETLVNAWVTEHLGPIYELSLEDMGFGTSYPTRISQELLDNVLSVQADGGWAKQDMLKGLWYSAHPAFRSS